MPTEWSWLQNSGSLDPKAQAPPSSSVFPQTCFILGIILIACPSPISSSQDLGNGRNCPLGKNHRWFPFWGTWKPCRPDHAGFPPRLQALLLRVVDLHGGGGHTRLATFMVVLEKVKWVWEYHGLGGSPHLPLLCVWVYWWECGMCQDMRHLSAYLHLPARATVHALVHFPATGLICSLLGLLPFVPPQYQMSGTWSWLASSNSYKSVPGRIWKVWGEVLVGTYNRQTLHLQIPGQSSKAEETTGSPPWAPHGKTWNTSLSGLSQWICICVSENSVTFSNLHSGPSYASVFPLLSRVCFLCFVGLFCHTLSTFRSLYADHVPGWVYWEQQCLFGTNRWNEANWEHQRCPRTNHQTGSSLEKDSESRNHLGIRNWAL